MISSVNSPGQGKGTVTAWAAGFIIGHIYTSFGSECGIGAKAVARIAKAIFICMMNGVVQEIMRDFSPIVGQMKATYRLRVRRWRRSMSGCAWRVVYRDGRSVNWIESPYPKTPISLAIFLHEVGHHAIGFHRYRLRCEEEYHVWIWALEAMRRFGVEPDARVMRRFERSMQYAVGKAMRRGVKRLPEALVRFTPRPD